MTDTSPRLELNVGRLLDAIDRVKHAAAKDGARPILASIVIDVVAPDTIRLAAADNYRVATLRLDAVEIHGDWRQAVIYQGDLPLIRTLLRSAGKNSQVTLTRTDTHRLRVFTVRGTLEVALIDGQYPNIGIVIDPCDDFPEAVALNPKYLAEAAKAQGDDIIARVYVKDRMSPMVVRFGDDYAEYVMPVRTSDWPAPVPAAPAEPEAAPSEPATSDELPSGEAVRA